ncbi:armadillo-type protein [Dipodascopsis uninucleata]
MSTTVPLDILKTLQVVAIQDSGNEDARRAAEAQLKTWENEAGFYSLLQDIFLDETFPVDIRWISIIYFKNGIDKHWRRSAPNAISREEKMQIRSKIPRSFLVTNTQLTTQNALAIARISKIDFPVEWPSLLSDILSAAQAAYENNDLSTLKQILVILNQVVKALSSTRFGKTRMALQSSTPDLVRTIGNWYVLFTQQWMNVNGSEDMGTLGLQVQIGYLSLKICRRLVSEGYEFADRHSEAGEFFQITTNHLTQFIEFMAKEPSEPLEKHILTLGKFYQDLSDRQPTAFILMPRMFDMIKTYLSVLQTHASTFHSQESEDVEVWEKIVVRGLLLLRKCIKMGFGDGAVTIKYRTPEDRAETKAAIEMLKTQLCQEQFISQIHDILLWSYLRLRSTELERWVNEPEDFVYDEIQNSWEYQLRPCAEKVYIELLLNFKGTLRNRSLEAFNAARSSTDMNDDAILAKDAAYNAFSITANALFEDVDFDGIFLSILAPEVLEADSNTPSMHRIILRRISLIISNWISVKCGSSTRKDVYNVLTRLMDPNYPLNDMVVQLTAASALKCAVDEWDFSLDAFLPYLENFLVRLVALISKVAMIETKLSILQVISVIVEVAETHILAYADKIVALLPALWDQAGDEHILKGAILQTLTNLIKSTGKESFKFHALYIPLIAGIVDPKSELNVYLLEDALDLWQSTIITAASATPELLSLLPILLEYMDQGTENLRIVLSILEGYVVLVPQYVNSQHGREIFSIMRSFIGNLKLEACHSVTHIIELFFQTLPMNEFITDIVDTGLLDRLLESVFDSHESAINITRYLTIFARLTLSDPNMLIQFCDHYGSQKQLTSNSESQSCLGPFLDMWISKVENMGHPRVRKLTALAFEALLKEPASHRPEITERIEFLASTKNEIIGELDGEDININIEVSQERNGIYNI